MATYRIGDLLNIASQASRLSVKTIVGRSRYERHKNVRFAVALIARDFGHSYPQIGRRLGGRDHSTIINAVEKAKIYYERCDKFATLVDTIRAKADEIEPFEKLTPEQVDFIPPAPPKRKFQLRPIINRQEKEPDEAVKFHLAIERGTDALAAAILAARAA